ncbi:MAG: flavodoxin family protein [Acidiferrobacterales bacterium]
MEKYNNVLAVYYSQAQQTTAAVEAFLAGISRTNTVRVSRIVLSTHGKFPMPWSFFSFFSALPGCVSPSMPPCQIAAATVNADSFDLLILGYPVWFLSPAIPVTSFLNNLPDGALENKVVITIVTCRNMWVEAQKTIRSLIEKKGGRVIAHMALVDRAPLYASLITTPRYFLTGKKGFNSVRVRKLLPDFGIQHEDFSRLRAWAERQSLSSPRVVNSHYEFDPSMALAETCAKQLFRMMASPWSWLQSFGRWIRYPYAMLMAMSVLVAIIVLLPPVVIAGRIPAVRARAMKWSDRLISTPVVQ